MPYSLYLVWIFLIKSLAKSAKCCWSEELLISTSELTKWKQDNNQGSISTSYVIKTNTSNDGLTLYWRKYLSNLSSRSQNDVYLINNQETLKYRSKKNIRVQLKRFLVESSVWYGSLFLQSFTPNRR